jgi:hypothetical protein
MRFEIEATVVDIEAKDWRAAPGFFDVLIGQSSTVIKLRGKVRLTE